MLKAIESTSVLSQVDDDMMPFTYCLYIYVGSSCDIPFTSSGFLRFSVSVLQLGNVSGLIVQKRSALTVVSLPGNNLIHKAATVLLQRCGTTSVSRTAVCSQKIVVVDEQLRYEQDGRLQRQSC
jgi:hypothetical protein